MRARSLWVLLVFATIGIAGGGGELFAQESAPVEPEPYELDEFSEFLHGVRRFEIILVGSFPLTYLLAFLVFDIGNFIYQSVLAGQVAGTYAPIFFAPPNKPTLNQEETIGVILAGVAGALCVAIVDLIIQEVEKSKRGRLARDYNR